MRELSPRLDVSSLRVLCRLPRRLWWRRLRIRLLERLDVELFIPNDGAGESRGAIDCTAYGEALLMWRRRYGRFAAADQQVAEAYAAGLSLGLHRLDQQSHLWQLNTPPCAAWAPHIWWRLSWTDYSHGVCLRMRLYGPESPYTQTTPSFALPLSAAPPTP